MKRLVDGILLVGLGACALSACKRDEAPLPAASAVPAVATAAQAAVTAAATGATTGAPTAEATPKGPCPFPRRCNEACWKAHFAALESCKADWQVIEKELPNVKEMGECTAHCLKPSGAQMCVGPATKAECDCIDKCSAGASAAQKQKGEPYLRCYAKAVAAACY